MKNSRQNRKVLPMALRRCFSQNAASCPFRGAQRDWIRISQRSGSAGSPVTTEVLQNGNQQGFLH